jgi:hypothetical protein
LIAMIEFIVNLGDPLVETPRVESLAVYFFPS